MSILTTGLVTFSLHFACHSHTHTHTHRRFAHIRAIFCRSTNLFFTFAIETRPIRSFIFHPAFLCLPASCLLGLQFPNGSATGSHSSKVAGSVLQAETPLPAVAARSDQRSWVPASKIWQQKDAPLLPTM